MIRFSVPLRARPQGSKRHVGNGIMLEMAGDALKEYRRYTADIATATMRTRPALTDAVFVSIEFQMQRPKKHYKGSELRDDAPIFCYPCKRGDIDKLVRSTLDAITGPVLKDDAQVVGLTATVVWAKHDSTNIEIEAA